MLDNCFAMPGHDGSLLAGSVTWFLQQTQFQHAHMPSPSHPEGGDGISEQHVRWQFFPYQH